MVSGWEVPNCFRDETPRLTLKEIQQGWLSDLQAKVPRRSPSVGDASSTCKFHPGKTLEFFCRTCEEALCLNCKLTKHEQHPTDDLSTALTAKKAELETERQHAHRALDTVTSSVTSLRQEREGLEAKRAAVERNIRGRHALVVNAAQRKMDQELASLRDVCAQLDRDISSSIEDKQRSKNELHDLLQTITSGMSSNSPADLSSLATDLQSGRGLQVVTQCLNSSLLPPAQPRPVLTFKGSADVMIQTARDYIGSVRKAETKNAAAPVMMKATANFRCADENETDVEVFSLCHLDTEPGSIIVSFERLGMKKNAPYKRYSEAGKCVHTDSSGKQTGKVSYKRRAKGWCMYSTIQEDRFPTYCKSPAGVHFRLDNNLSGQAAVNRVTVTSTDPFRTDITTEFSIQVGPHRAFDIDDAEQNFVVVVEEAKKAPRGGGTGTATTRNVRLFQRHTEKAVHTYKPPCGDYLPSDVCFYALGGRKVLLVTDELNDVIHVVRVQPGGGGGGGGGGSLKGEGFLGVNPPSCLIQPTAIAVDVKNRLWVACRGGAILCLEPVEGQ